MKEKEIYLADLISLKENISNKIMEEIQDLEAKNLKKIEKKIEKASQKIAMGLIKASLKNAELLTRKITHAIGPIHTYKNAGQNTTKKRGRPSLNKAHNELLGLESGSSISNKEGGSMPKKRGRPSKLSLSNSNINLKYPLNSPASSIPKKRGRPFGSTSKTVLVSDSVNIEIPKKKRGRPKLLKTIGEPSLVENFSLQDLRKRGRPRVNKESNQEPSKSPKLNAIKGRRGRPSKLQNSIQVINITNTKSLNASSVSSEESSISVHKVESPTLDQDYSPKTRGRKPKNPIHHSPSQIQETDLLMENSVNKSEE